MEGLALTPDGRALVGVMQSALQQPDLTKKPGNVTTLRIVTVDLRTRATHEYLYLLDDPATTGTAVSEITALSATRFLVDERDGKLEPGAYKKLFEIDLAGATDVGPRAAGYDAVKGGVLVGGKSIDAYVGKDTTADAIRDLAAAGITPVSKKLSLDLGALVTGLDPAAWLLRARQGRGCRHHRRRPDAGHQQRQRLRHRRRDERGPAVRAAPEDAAGRPSGRRRVPRGRHDQAPGGHQHGDGHHRRPVAIST